MKFRHSVAVGKFIPPHRGHEFLFGRALDCSETLHVIVCSRADDPIPASLRAAWIQELFPTVQVLVVDDHYDATDSDLWARLTIAWLGLRPDAVFTSEDYGTRFAAALGCEHVLVDQARGAVPCSGTAVRADPYANWDFISVPIRAWYAKRICLIGAESTGTTTTAHSLAQHFETNWVEEYGREYSVAKLHRGETIWRSEEFIEIAAEQNRREDAAARIANRVLVCDTNSFATTLWHRRYLDGENPIVVQLAAKQRPDLYLLTGDEIPFVQDGLRDGEKIRHEMHGWFEAALRRQRVPWKLLSGSPADRLKTAGSEITRLFADSAWKPKPF